MVKFLKRHRWALIALTGALLLLGVYKIGTVFFAQSFYRWVSYPLMRMLRRLSDRCAFGLTEWVIGIFIAAVIAGVIALITLSVKRRRQGYLTDLALGACAAALLVYCGYCYLWGSSYYIPTLRESAGIEREEHSVQQLYELTCKYALALNASYTK